MPLCDHHDLPLIDGWHVLSDPEGLEGDQRVPCPTLDAAWQAAEAALPNGPEKIEHPLWRWGTWRMQVVGPWDIEYNGHRPTWQAIADPYNATGEAPNAQIEALGSTPAEALRSLAEKLGAR